MGLGLGLIDASCFKSAKQRQHDGQHEPCPRFSVWYKLKIGEASPATLATAGAIPSAAGLAILAAASAHKTPTDQQLESFLQGDTFSGVTLTQPADLAAACAHLAHS